METQREDKRICTHSLQGAVHFETSYISRDDCFAAQIVYATGRCPPIYRLPATDSFLSFLRFEMV